jgi:hypothetical protein
MFVIAGIHFPHLKIESLHPLHIRILYNIILGVEDDYEVQIISNSFLNPLIFGVQ